MKRTITTLIIICILFVQKSSYSQIYLTADAQSKIKGASSIAYKQGSDLPVYIKMEEGKEIEYSQWQTWISTTLKLSSEMGFVYQNAQTDQKGDIHYRYCQTFNEVPILGNVLIIHTKNAKVYSFNGQIVSSLDIGSTTSITEQAALSFALANVNATKYKWEIPAEENMLKQLTGNTEATYYPKGELYIVHEGGNIKSQNLKLAYRFDIYATKPLSREYVFVDAITGEIIFKLNRLQTTDTPGTAQTKYSGTQSIITDSYGGSYRLREAGRGNGVETYDMNTGTDYGQAVDFTDANNIWNNINADQDEIATDAHWGTEMTYDYFYNKFNRNSIDDNGFKLVSYVHYDVSFANAFWDGNEMTYGDGDGTYTAFTTLDICGHEITHGLDEMTANLIYSDESGALNEGYSDIFGTCVEWFARPTNCNWLMGEDIGSAFRNMSDPNSMGQPDTYLGVNWDPGQEVHQNAGVLAYWFYLTSVGGSGTNDNGDAYNITGISMDSAAAVAFRTMTVYLPSGATYADARFYSIQAAMDLFGACTPEVATVTNAWYAVGVGAAYNPTVVSSFSADHQSFCTIPATVQFTNLSTNSNQFTWNFGDGSPVSTVMNPSHTYTTYGNYTVTLIASGGSCGTDTHTEISYISVDTVNACIVIMPETGTGDTQTACNGTLFDSGGTGDYQNNTNSTITIAPLGAMSVTLNFLSFNYELNYDYLTIYDGPSTLSPLIGSYTGSSLPNGGTINSTGGAITIVQTSDVYLTFSGFELNWHCSTPTAPPVTNFKADDTLSCTGIITFTDLSSNGPTSWLWNFGDGNTSTLQQPTHTYLYNGVYTVKLRNANNFGPDSLTKTNYITINKPADPIVVPASRCNAGHLTLSASGGTNYFWYDAPVSGNLLGSGSSYTTPVLGSTTTYYVENSSALPAQYFGPFDNSIGGGNYYLLNNYRYLIFNCFTPVTLVSVKVFSNSSGNRTIELSNSAGTVLLDTTVNIPIGESRVTLNFDLPVGTNLRLGTYGAPDLWRNNSGAVFPYTLPGQLAITGTNAGANGYYYYFYDWEVEQTGCLSNRVPVTASIILPTAQVSPNGNITVCSGQNVTLTAQTADSYLWTPGNQTTQSITVSTAGSYTVQITQDTCTATSLPVVVSIITNIPVASFSYTDNDPILNFNNTSLYGATYSWDFGDGGTSTSMNPSHTYTANGTFLVTMIVTNACGSDTTTTQVDISGVGISSYESNSTIAIYPNPSKGSFYLDIATSLNEDINYKIFDVIGKVVRSGVIRPQGSKTKMLISMGDAGKGVYMLRLYNTYLNRTKKIVID